MAVTLKQNDTAPSLVYDLLDNAGLSDEGPIDLTDATSVTFKMRAVAASPGATPKVSRAMTITDAATGRVTLDLQVGDTDTVADYNVEFQILWDDGKIETVPHDGYLTIKIVDDLDAT